VFSNQLKEGSQLRLVLVTTAEQYNKYTQQDILEADVVIVSHPFLRNPRYINVGMTSVAKCIATKIPFVKKRARMLTNRQRAIRPRKLSDMRKEANDREDRGSCFPFILNNFYWHRIILDEGHNVLEKQDHFYFEELCSFEGRSRWVTNEKPFPNWLTLKGVMRFLRIKSSDPQFEIYTDYQKTHEQAYTNWVIADKLFSNLHWNSSKRQHDT